MKKLGLLLLFIAALFGGRSCSTDRPSADLPSAFVVTDVAAAEPDATPANPVAAKSSPATRASDGFYYRQVNGVWQKYVNIPQWVSSDAPPAQVKLAGHYERVCDGNSCRQVWVEDAPAQTYYSGDCGNANCAGGCGGNCSSGGCSGCGSMGRGFRRGRR